MIRNFSEKVEEKEFFAHEVLADIEPGVKD